MQAARDTVFFVGRQPKANYVVFIWCHAGMQPQKLMHSIEWTIIEIYIVNKCSVCTIHRLCDDVSLF